MAYACLERQLLERIGVPTLIVGDFVFLAEVKARQPRLVIVGVSPAEERLDLVIDLRANPATRCRSILVTAPRGRLTLRKIRMAGANEVLWKPFAPESFIRQARRLLETPPRSPSHKAVVLHRRNPLLDPVDGVTLNASERGLLLHTPHPLDVRDRVLVEVGAAKVNAVVVRVAWERGPAHYGLELCDSIEAVGAALAVLRDSNTAGIVAC